MTKTSVRSRPTGIDRRRFLGMGAAAGALAVTVTADGLEVHAAEPGALDPGSGTPYTASAPTPDAFVIPVTAGARLLTEGFNAFIACADGGTTLNYVRDGGIGRGVVYAPTGWVHAPLHVPAGASIVRIDVFGRRATYGTQYWKVQGVPVLDLGRTDPVSDITTVSIPATTGVTHGVPPITTPISVQSGWSYDIVLTGTDANNQAGGFVVQYTPPRREFVPITPTRVFDTRLPAFGPKLQPGTNRLVNVKHAIDPFTGVTTITNVVPLGATAVTYNLTITQTQVSALAFGYLALAPGTSTVVTASAINWTAAGLDLANGGVIQLGTGSAERQITIITQGSATHAILDVTGYYI